MAAIPAVNNLAVIGFELGLNITWDPPSDVSCLSKYYIAITAVSGDNRTTSTTDTSSTFTDLEACIWYTVQVTPMSEANISGTAASAGTTTSDSSESHC